MKLGNLSKAAVVVALMMGQVTPPSSNGFYEEDDDFNIVSSTFSAGWGWGLGLNKAYANCETIPADATVVPDYCGGVSAPRLEWPDIGPGPGDDPWG
jgi:hypothetical protein